MMNSLTLLCLCVLPQEERGSCGEWAVMGRSQTTPGRYLTYIIVGWGETCEVYIDVRWCRRSDAQGTGAAGHVEDSPRAKRVAGGGCTVRGAAGGEEFMSCRDSVESVSPSDGCRGNNTSFIRAQGVERGVDKLSK